MTKQDSSRLVVNNMFPNETDTQRKLREFRSLEPGWYYGEGDSPSPAALDLADRLYQATVLFSIKDTDAFPSANGDVLLVAYLDGSSIEMTATAGGHIEICREVGNKVVQVVKNADMATVMSTLRKHATVPWNSFDSPPVSITIENVDGSPVRASKRMVEESRWFRSNVSTARVGRYISIVKNTTSPNLIPIPSSTGS